MNELPKPSDEDFFKYVIVMALIEAGWKQKEESK